LRVVAGLRGCRCIYGIFGKSGRSECHARQERHCRYARFQVGAHHRFKRHGYSSKWRANPDLAGELAPDGCNLSRSRIRDAAEVAIDLRSDRRRDDIVVRDARMRVVGRISPKEARDFPL
jgi:hypothetical protein